MSEKEIKTYKRYLLYAVLTELLSGIEIVLAFIFDLPYYLGFTDVSALVIMMPVCLVNCVGFPMIVMKTEKSDCLWYLFWSSFMPAAVLLFISWLKEYSVISLCVVAVSVLMLGKIFFNVIDRYCEKDWDFIYVKYIRCAIVCFVALSILVIAPARTAYIARYGSPVSAERLLNTDNVVYSDVSPKNVEIRDDSALAACMEGVEMLVDGTWSEHSDEEKLDALQYIANLETSFLGCEPVVLVIGDIRDSITSEYYIKGQYNHSEKTVIINRTGFSGYDETESLTIVLHEVRHHYQRSLVEAYRHLPKKSRNLAIFEQASEYDKEFSDYTSPGRDLLGYHLQATEIDAYAYGNEKAPEYLRIIGEYFAGICC